MSDFLSVNADLHMHGLYSGAVSKDMTPRVIAEQAPLKGLQLVGSADILNGRWMDLVRQQLEAVDDSIFIHKNGTRFVLQTEVEDNRRVHHVIFFPSISKVQEVKERLAGKSADLDGDGRPKIHLSGAEIAQIAIDAGCLIGPSHAFTPWTALFKEYDSLKGCYGDLVDKIHFLELGLSADTDMADRISDLHRVTFLSNSDAHSPWPNKLGREFNTLSIMDVTFDELSKAIKREGGRGVTLNVKFDPKEGRYHKTRCINCLTFFSALDASSYKWRCPICRSPIKKGVAERVEELADLKEPKHPVYRPPCLHTIPLSEIIASAIGTKQAYSVKVQEMWKRFISRFGNEITVLIKTPIDQLKEVDSKTAEFVGAFRENRFSYIPGGGGAYGIPVPPGKEAKMKVWKDGKVQETTLNERVDSKQRSLSEFFE
jgi:uncharacterized protein (TIGR00375 family)